MTKKTHTISIRLLRDGKAPAGAVRDGVTLGDWDKIDGAKIALGTQRNDSPKWGKVLDLSAEQKALIYNVTAFGLVFLKASGRWFALSFGMGHAKLDPDAFEQDFGLRVVLNTVASDRLRSADIRTPDENTTTRRTQTARRSDQTAFSIDIERDIVRGLAGEPQDASFAHRVAGSDGLTLTKDMDVTDLPLICADALAAFDKTDYKANFGWVDQIRHVRDKTLIASLDGALVAALNAALAGLLPDTLHLAYPVIYDPEKARHIRYKGFNSSNLHPDLDIADYIADLKVKGVSPYAAEHLSNHKVQECDSAGTDEGGCWKIRDCLVFETDLNGRKYVLSGDRWYCIDGNLAKEVTDFFATVPLHTLPAAQARDNEQTYNQRVEKGGHDLLCLDRKLVPPTGQSHGIEACDFLGKDGALIHVKDQTSSSRLSHLFNQGTVSARVLKRDGAFRDLLRAEIVKQQVALALSGYDALVVGSTAPFDPSTHKVVYAVICGAAPSAPRLPFFSLVTFRQAAKLLEEIGFPYAFAWISKPAATPGKKKRKPKSGGTP
jgi:uncharacterized protein (TIGR04141 family)